MLSKIKAFLSPDLTVEQVESGAAFLTAILRTPFFTPEHPGPDVSERVKKYGTPTRIFKNVRHDN